MKYQTGCSQITTAKDRNLLLFDYTSAKCFATCCCPCPSEPLSVTWEYLSTMTSACGPMCRGRCRDVLLLWQLRSIRCSVSDSVFHSCRVAGLAMPSLRQRITCRASYITAPSTSVSAQCCCQTNSPIFSVRSGHTVAMRPSLAAVSRMHRLQTGCGHLPRPRWSCIMVSFRQHPARHWF